MLMQVYASHGDRPSPRSRYAKKNSRPRRQSLRYDRIRYNIIPLSLYIYIYIYTHTYTFYIISVYTYNMK